MVSSFIPKSGLLLIVLIMSTAQFFSCKKKTDTPAPPATSNSTLSILSVTDERDNKNSKSFRFYINVLPSTTKEIKINYTTVDSNAIAGIDYTAATGVLTIAAGQSSAFIDVMVKGDSLRKEDQYFFVQLSNPVNAKIEGLGKATGLIQNNGTYLLTDNTGYSTPSTYPGMTLVWGDEFSATELNQAFWNYEIGNGSGGWGNNELEYYTNSKKNSFLSNGNLVIEAKKESISGFNYSSARLTTQNKKTFKFGRIDIRAKLPVSKGMWPALWMLGANISSVGWPSCGEIDIMELIGTYPGKVYGTMHWKPVSGANTSKGYWYDLPSGNFSQQFHVFSISWKQDEIKWFVDDQLFLTTTKTDIGSANYPFNADQFLIFNVAVGGNWPGSPDATTVFPQRMFVDYVRVFQ